MPGAVAARTLADAVAVLFVLFRSGAADAAVAVLLINTLVRVLLGASAELLATIVTVALAPLATVPSELARERQVEK